MDLMEFALKFFLFPFSFFSNLEIADQALFSFSLKKEQNSFTKKVFTTVMDNIISHEQPSESALLVIINNTGFPKYRSLYLKLEEAYLLLFMEMMTSDLTANAPKRKLKIKV